MRSYYNNYYYMPIRSVLLPTVDLSSLYAVVHWGGPRLRNDLYCVEWGVKLYSLTHPCTLLA